MNIVITKEFMYEETNKVLRVLFSLQDVEQIIIKKVIISSVNDKASLTKAIDRCFHDVYSDVDIEIKIKLNQDEYYKSSPIYADNVSRLGFDNDILGMSHYCTEERGEVIRVCKTNGMRFDLIIYARCECETLSLPHTDISEEIEKVNRFWFVAIQALGKLMRRDYLIASHLAHMLIQEGLVLQMLLRDREKGTNVHRYGYAEQLDYLKVYNSCFLGSEDETYNHISKLLYSAVISYDRLHISFEDSYNSRSNEFLAIWEFYLQN